MVVADQSPPHLPSLTFEGFTFDPARGVLTAEAREVVLRPKTTAVLAHLLAHAGELVSRDALLTAVWGDVAITDDSLTQCISEIRRALGPTGAGLLRTHARRGYMMATRSRPVVPAANPAPPLSPGSAADVLKPASNMLRSRVAWVALAVGACALMLSTAVLMGMVRAPDPSAAPAAVEPGDLSPWAQARQLLAEGRLAQQGVEPFPERLRASLPLFLRALEVDPGLADAAAEAAFVHVNLRNYNASQDPAQDLREAERLAALALAARPDATMALAAQAAVLRQQRRFAEALAFYERAGRVVDRANIGLMHLMLGDAEAAMPWLRAALQERPLHEFAASWQVFLGLARLMLGQPDLAANDFLPSGVSTFPVEERLLYRLVALRQSGRPDEAEALEADLRGRDPALFARPLRATGLSDEAAYRARFASAVLEPLRRMGWSEVGR